MADVTSRKRRWAEDLSEGVRQELTELEKKVSFFEQECVDLTKELEQLTGILSAEQKATVLVKTEKEEKDRVPLNGDVEFILPVKSAVDCPNLVVDEGRSSWQTNAGELTVMFSRCPVTADFPHARPNCYRYRFTQNGEGNSEFCPKCYCFVCDKPASECLLWTGGLYQHCDASQSSLFWRKNRQLMKVSILPDVDAVVDQGVAEKIHVVAGAVQSLLDIPKKLNRQDVDLRCGCMCHNRICGLSSGCYNCTANHPNMFMLDRLVTDSVWEVERLLRSESATAAMLAVQALIAAFLDGVSHFLAAGWIYVEVRNAASSLRAVYATICVHPKLHVAVWKAAEKNILAKTASKGSDKDNLGKICGIFQRVCSLKPWTNPFLDKALKGKLRSSEYIEELPAVVHARIKQLMAEKRYKELLCYCCFARPSGQEHFAERPYSEAHAAIRQAIVMAAAHLGKTRLCVQLAMLPLLTVLPNEFFHAVGVKPPARKTPVPTFVRTFMAGSYEGGTDCPLFLSRAYVPDCTWNYIVDKIVDGNKMADFSDREIAMCLLVNHVREVAKESSPYTYEAYKTRFQRMFSKLVDVSALPKDTLPSWMRLAEAELLLDKKRSNLCPGQIVAAAKACNADPQVFFLDLMVLIFGRAYIPGSYNYGFLLDEVVQKGRKVVWMLGSFCLTSNVRKHTPISSFGDVIKAVIKHLISAQVYSLPTDIYEKWLTAASLSADVQTDLLVALADRASADGDADEVDIHAVLPKLVTTFVDSLLSRSHTQVSVKVKVDLLKRLQTKCEGKVLGVDWSQHNDLSSSTQFIENPSEKVFDELKKLWKTDWQNKAASLITAVEAELCTFSSNWSEEKRKKQKDFVRLCCRRGYPTAAVSVTRALWRSSVYRERSKLVQMIAEEVNSLASRDKVLATVLVQELQGWVADVLMLNLTERTSTCLESIVDKKGVLQMVSNVSKDLVEPALTMTFLAAEDQLNYVHIKQTTRQCISRWITEMKEHYVKYGLEEAFRSRLVSLKRGKLKRKSTFVSLVDSLIDK